MGLKSVAKPREQILALIVVVGILVLFLRAVYFPGRIAQAQRAVQIHNLTMEKEALEKFTQALLAELPKVRAKEVTAPIKVLQGEIAAFAKETSVLLTQWTTPSFLRGAEVKKMSGLPPEKMNGYTVVHFAFQAEGPFRNIFYFLNRVEKFPALVAVDQITLKALDSKASRVNLELNGSLFQLENNKG